MAAKRLQPCPEGSAKCVSTLNSEGYPGMDAVPFSGSPEDAKTAVLKVIDGFPRTAVTTDEGDYVSSIFKTAVFRFKDTVEFEIDRDDSVVHFRSESVPYAGSDLGANRKRMTKVREQLVAALG